MWLLAVDVAGRRSRVVKATVAPSGRSGVTPRGLLAGCHAGSMAVQEMHVETTEIDGLLLIRMKQVDDERGLVREFYRESGWFESVLP
jgi:hypothetical protein